MAWGIQAVGLARLPRRVQVVRMWCQNCGNAVGRDDSFCRLCGQFLAPPATRVEATTAGRRIGYEPSQEVVIGVAECQVVPGETARFPFTTRGGDPSPATREFSVISDNPEFDPGWVHVIKATDGMASPRYALEIRPAHIRRSQFGRYSVWIRWDKPGALQPAFGRCTLVIKPCVRLKGKPALKTWPGGMISLSLENCGGAGVAVSISISHQGSSWSQGWEFGLEAGDGPFKFEESFEPPAGGRSGQFHLEVSVEGVSLIDASIRPNNFVISPKHVVAGAVVLAGAVIGFTLVHVLPGSLAAQSISFTSQPASLAVGTRYLVSAQGGGSGNAVAFTIDPPSARVCSMSGRAKVTFNRKGNCVIDANEAGNAHYQPASRAQQEIAVGSRAKTAQSISFTSQPSSSAVGATYLVSARGGGSGNPVVFSVDSSSASVCSVSGATVTFNQAGTCVIDANQAGNARYQPASLAHQEITVSDGTKASQSIIFTSKPSNPVVSATYLVSARGGGSGNPVVFSVDSSSASVCSVSGATVTFNQAGTCVIDANQAGNARYQPASQAQQKIVVAKQSQTISFSSQPPAPSFNGDTYAVSATATSKEPVTITIDPSSASVCSMPDDGTVNFNEAGTCAIDANQAGNSLYAPAPQVQQVIDVQYRVP